MTDEPSPRDAWSVHDPDEDNTLHFETQREAEERAERAREQLAIDAEVHPPGKLPGDTGSDAAPTETLDVARHTALLLAVDYVVVDGMLYEVAGEGFDGEIYLIERGEFDPAELP